VKIQKGVSSARSDDTKSLKGPILDWITPRGQPLNPPLGRNVKMDRGFHHERTGALLCPAGLDWANTEYVVPIYYLLFPLANLQQGQGEVAKRGDGSFGRPMAAVFIRGVRL
jgi:hypothetical protein